jgi:hypothetical protein
VTCTQWRYKRYIVYIVYIGYLHGADQVYNAHHVSLPSFLTLYHSPSHIMLQSYFTQMKEYISPRQVQPTPSAMTTHLKPEILLLIAKHIRRPFPKHNGRFATVEKAVNADQETLLNLMKTSEVSLFSSSNLLMVTDCQSMYDLCASVLYSDCTLRDFTTFAAGYRTNENTDRTTRLHIHHEPHWSEATYAEIFEPGWEMLEIKDHLHLDPVGRDLMGVMEECHALVQEGKRIRRFITEGLSVLPRLHTVAMWGIGETLFNDVGGFPVEQIYSCRFEDNAKILPHALINLPTIRNYCQTVFYGPLALPNKIIKVESALQTFTTHFRGSQTFSNCLTVQELRSPKIILGATNRYFCESAAHAP